LSRLLGRLPPLTGDLLVLLGLDDPPDGGVLREEPLTYVLPLEDLQDVFGGDLREVHAGRRRLWGWLGLRLYFGRRRCGLRGCLRSGLLALGFSLWVVLRILQGIRQVLNRHEKYLLL